MSRYLMAGTVEWNLVAEIHQKTEAWIKRECSAAKPHDEIGGLKDHKVTQ